MTVTTYLLDGICPARTLRPLAVLAGDPTVRLTPGRFERASTTPEGPATVVLRWGTDGCADAETHGDGARWMAERVPGLLGLHDDVAGFAPPNGPLREAWRRHRGARIPRTGTLWHDLAWFVVQQRVSSADAAAQWRRMVAALGTPAPGMPGLRLPPEPEAFRALAYFDLHRFGIERKRADTLLAAARMAARLERLADADVDLALPALRSVPGIGPWTTACLATHTWGDRDAVIVGDYGIPAMVSWMLAGERTADDARLLQLLEPYRPHRHRVVRLAGLSGARPPRRHHRGTPHDIRHS